MNGVINITRARKARAAIGVRKDAARASSHAPGEAAKARESRKRISRIVELLGEVSYTFRKDLDLFVASIEAAEKIAREAEVFSAASADELAVGIFAGHWWCRQRAARITMEMKWTARSLAGALNGKAGEVRQAKWMRELGEAIAADRDGSFLDVHMSILARGLEVARYSMLSDQDVLTPKRRALLAVTFYEGIFRGKRESAEKAAAEKRRRER